MLLMNVIVKSIGMYPVFKFTGTEGELSFSLRVKTQGE